jgi:hypothetical protein
MASFWYRSPVRFMMQREAVNAIDLDGDAAIKITLLDAGYTPAKGHDFADDFVSATNELNVTGYTRGFNGTLRKALASKAVNDDGANHRAVFDADDVTWTAIGGATNDTIASAVVLKEITNDAASPLILQLDIDPDVVTNGGDFTITFADGATQGLGYVGV